MNLDGSLDDDDEDEKKSRTSLTFSVRHGLKALLAWLGHSYVVLSGHAETGKVDKSSCSQLIVHLIMFITIRLPIICQDSRRLKSIYIT